MSEQPNDYTSNTPEEDRDALIRWIVRELGYPYDFKTSTPAPCLPLIALEWFKYDSNGEGSLADYFETVYEESKNG